MPARTRGTFGRGGNQTGQADFYLHGSFNRICDRCGKKRKARDTREEWNGLIVCTDGCWEIRHPQDFVRGKRDLQGVKKARPDTETFVDTNDVTEDDL